jgi:hypothetical protein
MNGVATPEQGMAQTSEKFKAMGELVDAAAAKESNLTL